MTRILLTAGAPPLDADLGSIDTSLPLLKDGQFYELRIEKAEVQPTSKGGKMIKLDMVTTMPTKSMKEEDLGPGIHVFDQINLIPTGKATWDMIARNAGALVQAAGLTNLKQYGSTVQQQLENAQQWVPQLNGRPVQAKLGYEPEGTRDGKSYRAKNVVLLYIKKK